MSLMRHSSRSKKLAVLIISLLAIATVAGAYHHFIYFPGKQEEERIKTLMEYAGFTREEAIRFDRKFKGYAPYNRTLLDFAYFLKRYPLTTSEIFRLTNSFQITVSSLKNAEPLISEIVTGDQKGRDFVLRYPFLILDDGLNATDAKLMFYDLNLKDLTSHIIEKIKDQSRRITTLNLLYPNIQNKTLTESQALDFIKKYPGLLPLNYSSLVLAKYWPRVSDLVDFLIGKYPVNIAKGSILLLYPNIKNKTLTTEASINFMTTYPDLVKEGINLGNLPYLKSYTRYPTLTDSVIKHISYDLGASLIFNLNPFLLNNTFTENKAAYFINLYPTLARSFGLHEAFPRLIYLFTQIPKTTDRGIKTIEGFGFLVNTLNSVLRYIEETKKKDEKIAFFIERYPWLIKEYDWDKENRRIFEFHELYPTLTDALLGLNMKRDYVLSTINNVDPYLKQIPEFTISDFIKSYKHLALDDGLNATDIRLLPYYHEYRLLTDTAIKELKDLDSILFVLDSYYPYIKGREISSLRLRNYILRDKDLFRVKEYVHPLADPDEDHMDNITEMKILRDLFFGIGNFSWTPTKVVNDKVYEGDVYTRAKSVRGILPGKLYWIPINYTQFPKEVQLRAFPNETIREFDLIPLNENLIETSIPIEGFKGGREYKIEITAKDKAGNVAKASLTTPYIREFENIAPLDDILVSAVYYTWYRNIENNWKDGYKRQPLLGEYRSDDMIVVNKHIDWATGHGIDSLLVSWAAPNDGSSPGWEKTRAFENTFLASPLLKDIKFAIFYESGSRLINSGNATWEIYDFGVFENKEIFLNDIKYFCEKYFSRNEYLKINGSIPVLYVFASNAWIGNFEDVIKEAKSIVRKYGNKDLYFIGNDITPYLVPPDLPEDVIKRINAFEMESSWVALHEGSNKEYVDNYENILRDVYPKWRGYLLNKNKDFVPSVIPSFDSRYVIWGSKDQYPVEKDLEKFEERLKITLDNLGKNKMMIICTWNDFFEDTQIEPSIDYKFEELHVLLSTLTTYRK